MQAWLGRLGVVVCLGAAGCGTGSVGQAVRPKDATAAEALGEDKAPECRSVAKYGEPLIVDMNSTERADLELAMRDGVAVVAYDCHKLELLKGCKVEGSYAFAGVSRKEDVVQLSNQDELRANLPLSAANLSAEVARGQSIDLALVMIGRKGTTVRKAGRAQLVGSCEGATHLVHAAYVGAFAMTKGSHGKARAVAEIFGAGTSAASQSDKKIENKDGELSECRKAKSQDRTPPDQCQSALRLELVPLAQEVSGGDEKPAETPSDIKNPCPEGMVLAGGKCTATATGTVTHLCKHDDETDCKAQCDAGDMSSCSRLGYIGMVKHSPTAEVDALFEKACKGGVPQACFERGNRVLVVRAHEADPAKKQELAKQAAPYFDKSCDLGDGWSCWNTGGWYLRKGALEGPWGYDADKGMKLVERGCALGYPFACSELARRKIDGQDTAKDAIAGLALYKRACDAGRWEDCESIGDLYREGKAVAKDASLALASYSRACEFQGLRACAKAANLERNGDGVPKDANKARALFERGCPETGSAGWDACEGLASMYEKGEAVAKDGAKAAELYLKGGLANRAGEIWEKGLLGVKPDAERALAAYDAGCHRFSREKNGAELACASQGRLLEKRDKGHAKDFYGDWCERMKSKLACDKFKSLGGTPTVKPFEPANTKAPKK